MLLRVAAPNQFRTIGGEPVELQGAISCCMEDDWGGKSGWPVNINPQWQDYAAQTFGANLFHARLGPFFGGEGREPQWTDVGGAYYPMPDGKADLTRWNEPFWDRVREWVEYAGERGRYVEIDVIDGWYCKHAVWGDVQTPWMPQFNVQGDAWMARCGKEEIQDGTVFDAWLRKVVTELGPYGNVIWEDGNEIGQVQGYTPAWSLSMRDRIRVYEQQLAFNVVHLFGTNSGNDGVRSAVDYVEEHRTSPLDGPMANRPSMVNEYNPRPPFTPTRMNDYRCFAEANGTWWWYWRHEQSLEQMTQTGELYRQPCGAAPACTVPGSNDPGWSPNQEQLNTVLWSQYRIALERLGDRCGASPDQTLAGVAAELANQGICAGGPWGDAVIAKRPDGMWEEWHAVSYANGCTIPTTGAYKGLWRHAGACPVPQSCGGKFAMDLIWNGTIDSTFTVTSCCDYCKSIGMGDYNGQPRCGCPVLPEGHPERPARERECIGVQRWWCNDIELEPCGATRNPNCISANPAQAYCSGHAKTCTADMRFCSEGDF